MHCPTPSVKANPESHPAWLSKLMRTSLADCFVLLIARTAMDVTSQPEIEAAKNVDCVFGTRTGAMVTSAVPRIRHAA